jgi:hypothetical protein
MHAAADEAKRIKLRINLDFFHAEKPRASHGLLTRSCTVEQKKLRRCWLFVQRTVRNSSIPIHSSIRKPLFVQDINNLSRRWLLDQGRRSSFRKEKVLQKNLQQKISFLLLSLWISKAKPRKKPHSFLLFAIPKENFVA